MACAALRDEADCNGTYFAIVFGNY